LDVFVDVFVYERCREVLFSYRWNFGFGFGIDRLLENFLFAFSPQIVLLEEDKFEAPLLCFCIVCMIERL